MAEAAFSFSTGDETPTTLASGRGGTAVDWLSLLAVDELGTAADVGALGGDFHSEDGPSPGRKKEHYSDNM